MLVPQVTLGQATASLQDSKYSHLANINLEKEGSRQGAQPGTARAVLEGEGRKSGPLCGMPLPCQLVSLCSVVMHLLHCVCVLIIGTMSLLLIPVDLMEVCVLHCFFVFPHSS